MQRTKRADTTAREEYEQSKIMGEGAAKVLTDAKRKSKILMKSDALAKKVQLIGYARSNM